MPHNEKSSRKSTTPPPDDVLEIIRRVDRVAEENRQLLERLTENEHRFRGLAKAVWRVQEQERRRLACELHDGIGQLLTALKTQLARMQQQADDGDLHDNLEHALSLADNALQDTRALSRLLRPPVLDDLGLSAALEWLGRGIRERTGITIEVHAGIGARLAPDLETLVFRVAQEAVTNAMKHAAAHRIELSARVSADNRLHLRVRDDGRGFDTTAATTRDGLGLRGMRDRAEVFGGRLAVESSPGTGTTVTLELPDVNPPEDAGP